VLLSYRKRETQSEALL